MILEGIVQERGNRLVFVAAVVQHQRADAEQVRHVRDGRPLAPIVRVQRRREHQRIRKT